MKYNFDEIINRENTASVKYDLRKELFGNEDILPMWVADMDFATPDFIRDAIIQRAKHPVYGYTFRDKQFFESIISWMKRRHNWEIPKDQIAFSPGVVPALNLSMLAYTRPGDKVIVQPPVYFPFFSAIKDHNRTILYNELINNNGFYEIDFTDFERKAKEAKMFILCHPHNPTGRLWSKNELQKLVNICKENNVLILSDEIHSDLILTNRKHIPVLHIPGSEQITIACYAPSKTFNLAGMSTSFLVIPEKKLKRKYEKMLNAIHIGMGNLFGNISLQAAYDHGEEWLEELLEYLRNNLDFTEDYIKNNIPEIKVTQNEATYLIWLDFRSLDIHEKKLKKFVVEEAGLGFNDGPMFGPGGKGFQRMNIAVPKSILQDSLSKLKKAISGIKK